MVQVCAHTSFVSEVNKFLCGSTQRERGIVVVINYTPNPQLHVHVHVSLTATAIKLTAECRIDQTRAPERVYQSCSTRYRGCSHGNEHTSSGDPQWGPCHSLDTSPQNVQLLQHGNMLYSALTETEVLKNFIWVSQNWWSTPIKWKTGYEPFKCRVGTVHTCIANYTCIYVPVCL